MKVRWFVAIGMVLALPAAALAGARGQNGPGKMVQNLNAPLIAAVLTAYGGREALAKVTTVAAHGRIDDDLRHVSGGYHRLMRRPDGLRIEIRPEQGGEIRILNGAEGWQGSNERFSRAQPLSLSSMRYQYGYLDLPMCLADQRCSATAQGESAWAGETYDLLHVTARNAPPLRVYLHRDSHLIFRVAADFDMGPMGTSELATEYGDYRPVGGIPFPHRLTNFAGGGKISQLSIEKLQVNTPLPDELFTVRTTPAADPPRPGKEP